MRRRLLLLQPAPSDLLLPDNVDFLCFSAAKITAAVTQLKQIEKQTNQTSKKRTVTFIHAQWLTHEDAHQRAL